MRGLHLTADLYGCRCEAALLTQPEGLAALCRARTLEACLTLVDEKWHKFAAHGGAAGGVTGMLLLAESHLAVHTWPERGAVTLDVYVCHFTGDNSGKARSLLDALQDAFQPRQAQRQELLRGSGEGPAPLGDWVLEQLTDQCAYAFRFDRRLLVQRTAFQQIELLESAELGRTLRLDGCYMTSEADEFFYHEALVHPAAVAHPDPRQVLILGGGDGGAAEEVLKHPTVDEVTLVELDPQVIEVARRELQAIHRGALDDRRVEVRCEDGAAFVAATDRRFDLVLLDLTDPETPAGPLYTESFFGEVRRVLAPGGAMVLHMGAPFYEGEQVRSLVASLRRVYRQLSCYGLHIPLYGAYWALAVASDSLAPATLPAAEVQARLDQRRIGDLQYYNAEVHGALFALPNYYRALVQP